MSSISCISFRGTISSWRQELYRRIENAVNQVVVMRGTVFSRRDSVWWYHGFFCTGWTSWSPNSVLRASPRDGDQRSLLFLEEGCCRSSWYFAHPCSEEICTLYRSSVAVVFTWRFGKTRVFSSLPIIAVLFHLPIYIQLSTCYQTLHYIRSFKSECTLHYVIIGPPLFISPTHQACKCRSCALHCRRSWKLHFHSFLLWYVGFEKTKGFGS